MEPARLKILLWIVVVGFFMQTLDSTIVNTALPAMARSLQVSPLNMHSVVIAYSLTMAMLIPASWLDRPWPRASEAAARLARQAADLLERTIVEEALRAREQELERTCAALRESRERQRETEAELAGVAQSQPDGRHGGRHDGLVEGGEEHAHEQPVEDAHDLRVGEFAGCGRGGRRRCG